MKKIVKRILLLFIIILIIQFLLFVFKKEHDVSYVVKTDNGEYKIHEIFKNNTYYYDVNYRDTSFVFNIDNSFYKKKKVLNKIYSYKKDNLICIYPDIEGSNIICSNDGILQSYFVSKDSISSFIKELQKKGYSNNSWKKVDSNIKKIGQVSVYLDNLVDNSYIYVWKYNGFYSITKDNLEQVQVFNNDTYLNKLGVLVDKYYLIPNYDNEYDFNYMYVYNIINNKRKKIKLKKDISLDSYINGVVDGNVYLTDTDSLIQYKIDPKKRKVVEVGNTKNGALYYDIDKFTNVNIYEYRKNNILFNYNDFDSIGIKNTSYNNKIGDIYYYLKNGKFYKFNNIYKVDELLFSGDITNVNMVDDDVYFIEGDNLYLYNGNVNKILSYDELEFNSNNRYVVYKK